MWVSLGWNQIGNRGAKLIIKAELPLLEKLVLSRDITGILGT